MQGGLLHRRVGPFIVGYAVSILAPGLALEDAEACTPEVGVVLSVTPTTGQHPANAAVVIQGYGLGTYGLSATIDDSLVELELDEELSMLSQIGAGHDTVALRLSPPPNPGQRVVISGNPSALGWEAPGTFLVEYVADEADVTPTLPPSWWWDVTYYEPFDDPDLIDSCGFYPSAGQGAITVRLDEEATVDRPAFVRFSVSPETWPLGSSFQRVEFAMSQEFTTGFTLYTDQLGEPVEETRLCVELELLDAAGNGSGRVERCLPCRMDLREQGTSGEWCRPTEHECPSEDPPETPGGSCDEPQTIDAGGPGEPEDPPESGEQEPTPTTSEGPRDAAAGASPGRDADDESLPPVEPDEVDSEDTTPPGQTEEQGDAVPAHPNARDAASVSDSKDAGDEPDRAEETQRRPVVENDGGCDVASRGAASGPRSCTWALVASLFLGLAFQRRRAV
jgi:hypothetical protein